MYRLIGFKEWLAKTSPEGGGDIWNNRSNADLDYGLSVRSKYTQSNINKSGQVELDPEKLFLGISKKRLEKINKGTNPQLGDINGTGQ